MRMLYILYFTRTLSRSKRFVSFLVGVIWAQSKIQSVTQNRPPLHFKGNLQVGFKIERELLRSVGGFG